MAKVERLEQEEKNTEKEARKMATFRSLENEQTFAKQATKEIRGVLSEGDFIELKAEN